MAYPITSTFSDLWLKNNQTQTATIAFENRSDFSLSHTEFNILSYGSDGLTYARDIEVLSVAVSSDTPNYKRATYLSEQGLSDYTKDWFQVYWTGGPKASKVWTITATIRGKSGVFGARKLTVLVRGDIDGLQLVHSQDYTLHLVNAAGQGDVPSIPTWQSLVPTSPTEVEATLNSSPASTTFLQISTSPTTGFDAGIVTATSGQGIKISRSGLLVAHTYYLRAYSQNTYGSSAYSEVRSVTTLSLPSAPEKPVITGIVPQATSVTATWKTSPVKYSGTTKYPNTYAWYRSTTGVTSPDSYILWSDTSGAPYNPPDTASTQTTNLYILLPSTTYYWKVRATNDGGSTDSDPFVVTTTEASNATPIAPSGLTATAVTAIPGKYTMIDLAWTDNSTIETSFWLDKSADGGTTWSVVSSGLPPNSTSYTATGLTAGTTYKFRIRAANSSATTQYSAYSSIATASTAAAPATPGVPTGVSALTVDDARIKVSFSPAAPLTAESYVILRSAVSGSGYVEIESLTADASDLTTETFSYLDEGLSAGVSYYYVVKGRNFAGTSAASAEASATTLNLPVQVAVSPPTFSLSDESENTILAVLGRTIFKSDLDRGIVRTAGGYWFKEGLKRQLTAPTLTAATGGGSLEAGTYRVYIMLYRSHDETRSAPSDASGSVTTTAGKKLRVAPELVVANDYVKCRDIGYDISGNEIKGCDFWEIYVAESNSSAAYLVAQLPLAVANWEDSAGSKQYTIDGTLTRSTLFSSSRRQMELDGQNNLPPCTSKAAFKGTHVITFGEKTIAPTRSEQTAGASLSISRGNHSFTVTNYTLPEGIIYHELWLNDKPTGFEVYDMEGSVGYIQHGDVGINAGGFPDTGGSYSNFKFIPKNRVYYSAWYSGGITSNAVFSPETFPPATVFVNEFLPDDGQIPNGIISLGDEAYVSKPGKWFVIRGGDETDTPQPQISAISNSSGCIAPKTICVDRRSYIYFLGDTGIHRVSQAGVEQVIDNTGNAYLFRELFDISSVPAAIGCYFSREEWVVFTNLNLIGNQGRKDGFIYDVRNNAIMVFSTLEQITAMCEIINVNGEFQISTGCAGNSSTGVLFEKGVMVDGLNWSLATPASGVVGIPFWERSGPIDTERAITVSTIQTRLRHTVLGSGYNCELRLGGAARNGNPDTFYATKREAFTSNDTRDRFWFAGNRNQQAMVEFSGVTTTDDYNQRLSWSGFIVEALARG